MARARPTLLAVQYSSRERERQSERAGMERERERGREGGREGERQRERTCERERVYVFVCERGERALARRARERVRRAYVKLVALAF